MLSLSSPSIEPLIRSLDRNAQFSLGDLIATVGLDKKSLVEKQPQADIAEEGRRPMLVRGIVSGWVCRYKDLPDGRRQILGFLLPGDFIGLNAQSLQRLDHSICALTPVRLVELFPHQLRAIAEAQPQLKKALELHSQTQSAILREWLLNIGQRSALERLAHLLLELYTRSEAIGLTSRGGMEFPITQCHLAEATGLTPVHVNRTVQELRRMELITWENGRLEIRELDQLRQLAMFDDGYLRLEEVRQGMLFSH